MHMNGLENLDIHAAIDNDNNSKLMDLELEKKSKGANLYQDCTKILVNTTTELVILIEYNYYEGYYLYPR